jgi:hypothetical protein
MRAMKNAVTIGFGMLMGLLMGAAIMLSGCAHRGGGGDPPVVVLQPVDGVVLQRKD